jgi:prepilin-type N-terminal cleavage/methylation domain-containing protein
MGGNRSQPDSKSARGFTLIELIVVIMVIGVVAGFSIPRVKDTMEKINAREAKVSLANYVARTRGSAVARGCPSTLNIVTGTSGRIWVTSCKSGDVGRTVLVDTVGKVDFIASRYGVDLQSSVAALTFDRRGIATTGGTQTIKVVGVRYATVKDSIRVSPVGKVLFK